MRFSNLKKFKKFAGIFGLVMTSSLLATPALRAQTTTTAPTGGAGDATSGGGLSSQYLKQIEENTHGVLDRLNNIPAYLSDLGVLIRAWVTADDSDTTAAMQANFSELSVLLTDTASAQSLLTAKLNTDLLNNSINSVTNANNDKANPSIVTTDNLWYANDLVYSTLFGSPFFSKDPRQQSGNKNTIDPRYNYIRNASALNTFHPMPGENWQGSEDAISRYQNYYNTVMAVESFGGYVLSNQYADNGRFDQLQAKLIVQASDPEKWFAKVASENIGFALRQILLYESQMFVLLTQILQAQKQAVAAQVMTNSLLITINQLNEHVMSANAQGTQPTV